MKIFSSGISYWYFKYASCICMLMKWKMNKLYIMYFSLFSVNKILLKNLGFRVCNMQSYSKSIKQCTAQFGFQYQLTDMEIYVMMSQLHNFLMTQHAILPSPLFYDYTLPKLHITLLYFFFHLWNITKLHFYHHHYFIAVVQYSMHFSPHFYPLKV